MDILNMLLEISIYAAVICTVLLLVKRLLNNRMSPALHYAVWALLIVRLMLPVTVDSGVHLFTLPQPGTPAQTVSSAEAYAPGVVQRSGSVAEEPAQPPVQPQSAAVQTPATVSAPAVAVQALPAGPAAPLTADRVLLAVWLAGVAAALAYIATAYALFRRQMRRAAMPVNARVRRLFEQCRSELGIKRPVRLLGAGGLTTPAIFVPATVIVPVELADAMDDTQLALALRHELTHYKRADHLLSVLLLALQAVYWFNPFVWMAFRRLRADMEVACDNAVTQRLGGEGKSEYAGMIIAMFSKGASGHLVLGMARGDRKKDAEQRIRGIFALRRSHKSAVLAVALTAALLLVGCFTTACQPTPAMPVVANKNAGVMESALAAESDAAAAPYAAPERLSYELDGLPAQYRVVFDAEVDVSDQTAWPVYSVEPARVTQQQADAVRTALLGGETLYKPGKYRSREEIQRSIDSYQRELEASEGYPTLIESYTGILKELYAEYERTPETLTPEPADLNLAFREEQTMAEFYGGREVILDDGGRRYEWTDEARASAVAAGCESIYGECWLKNGRKMVFSAVNDPFSAGIFYHMADGNLVKNPGVTCTADEAAAQADALLDAMGLDFTLVDAKTLMNSYYDDALEKVVEDGALWHVLTYKRHIDGVPQDNIISSLDQGIDEEYLKSVAAQESDRLEVPSSVGAQESYRLEVPSAESITFCIDDLGVSTFSWNSPMQVVSLDNAAVTLLPFETVQTRIEQQLKAQTLWVPDESESAYIDERRLEITKIKLSYLMMAKKDDLNGYYLAPVWNVCANMYEHYIDSYPSGDHDTYILDENNERDVWRSRDDTADYSVLTLNALDGSVVRRMRGY